MVFIRYIFLLTCFGLATATGILNASEIDLPDLGDSAGSIISPEQERNIAKSFMRELRRQAPLETDEEIVDYLNQLGEELGKNAVSAYKRATNIHEQEKLTSKNGPDAVLFKFQEEKELFESQLDYHYLTSYSSFLNCQSRNCYQQNPKIPLLNLQLFFLQHNY